MDGQLCIETCRGADRENAHQFGRALNSSSSSARPTSCALKARVKGARDGSYGFFWCFGACLDRLFPLIEINKEFTQFFNEPMIGKLTRAQNFFFSGLRIVGLAPGALLAAALAGLTQGF